MLSLQQERAHATCNKKGHIQRDCKSSVAETHKTKVQNHPTCLDGEKDVVDQSSSEKAAGLDSSNCSPQLEVVETCAIMVQTGVKLLSPDGINEMSSRKRKYKPRCRSSDLFAGALGLQIPHHHFSYRIPHQNREHVGQLHTFF